MPANLLWNPNLKIAMNKTNRGGLVEGMAGGVLVISIFAKVQICHSIRNAINLRTDTCIPRCLGILRIGGHRHANSRAVGVPRPSALHVSQPLPLLWQS